MSLWSKGVIVILEIELWCGAKQDSDVILDYIYWK